MWVRGENSSGSPVLAEWDVQRHIHSASQEGWPDRIHTAFTRHAIRQVGYVPDNGHARLIELCINDPKIKDVLLASEAEGPGLVLGAALGGERAALLMQSSGVGNCIITFSILKNCAIPCVVLVTMRGETADFNPWQVPMGSITAEVLTLCGFQTYRIDQESEVEATVDEACRMAFGGGSFQVAVLFSQNMVDRNKTEH